MTLQDWIDESKERIDEHGLLNGGQGSAKAFWEGALCRVGHRWNYGTHIFEHDWDVLLVLDTCRPDVLEDVAHEYEYVPRDVPSETSIGSASIEWVKKNFTNDDYAEELSETAYVTSNLFSEHIDPDDLYLLDEVWRYGWNDDDCTTPPEVVADRAIDVMREHDPERMVVHLMQPHAPYRSMLEEFPEWRVQPGPGEDDPSHPAREMWEDLRHGVISRQEIWQAYRDNLRWVLDDGVDLMLNNMDADDVVITADHGESFGEWGVYAHPPYCPVPVLKNVPWVHTSATDSGEYTPDIEPDETALAEDEVEDRLEALGYK
ncbi:hypothetical protein [Halorussus caseinilyticus]|uniref:Sulfatase n=1 Tax=Halorussus caseinilyticus TaxID=3034025 RepID=A0ABD5WM11_9EURY|nr:hypothetical protein [Halorussus sp. DT72]